ncbi:MAG: glutamate-5-semialdehyde dehydrogenase [Oscillospiraceae bacterium]|nr:glutamate-5-semialdehyde dehydrogenase [Oscillospiraceae bacterium]
MIEMLKAAKAAKAEVSALTTQEKNAAMHAMADALLRHKDAILEANAADLEAATGVIAPVMLDRLKLNEERIAGMAKGIREVAQLPDPVGRILDEHTRQDGLLIRKVSVPVGVIAIIYESRPNVTSDAAALALKSGNVCVLRGGKEAFRSAQAIVAALRDGLRSAGITENAINLVSDTSRESATALMTANGYVDILIPRGGAGLINACVRQATVPCIATGTGICHVYVDGSADLDMALKIVENAKTSRPSVCNAEEVLLVDRSVADKFLPALHQRLVLDRNIPVELRLDKEALEIIPGTAAKDEDFSTEFLDFILAVKCVSGVEEAVQHIAQHSTGHSEAIVASCETAINAFTAGVDSAAVYVNASTRFTDGGEFGLGCEMGISTQKLHARGPMGLRELTTYKYIIVGNGHIR